MPLRVVFRNQQPVARNLPGRGEPVEVYPYVRNIAGGAAVAAYRRTGFINVYFAEASDPQRVKEIEAAFRGTLGYQFATCREEGGDLLIGAISERRYHSVFAGPASVH